MTASTSLDSKNKTSTHIAELGSEFLDLDPDSHNFGHDEWLYAAPTRGWVVDYTPARHDVF